MLSRYSIMEEIYISDTIMRVICILLFQRKNNGRTLEDESSNIINQENGCK